jgi:hypothetical protein
VPTLKPRVALTLPESTRAAVRELAEAAGKPEATVIAELLSEMAPQLRDLAKLLRAAKEGRRAAARAALRDLVGSSMAEMMAASNPDLFKGK